MRPTGTRTSPLPVRRVKYLPVLGRCTTTGGSETGNLRLQCRDPGFLPDKQDDHGNRQHSKHNPNPVRLPMPLGSLGSLGSRWRRRPPLAGPRLIIRLLTARVLLVAQGGSAETHNPREQPSPALRNAHHSACVVRCADTFAAGVCWLAAHDAHTHTHTRRRKKVKCDARRRDVQGTRGNEAKHVCGGTAQALSACACLQCPNVLCLCCLGGRGTAMQRTKRMMKHVQQQLVLFYFPSPFLQSHVAGRTKRGDEGRGMVRRKRSLAFSERTV